MAQNHIHTQTDRWTRQLLDKLGPEGRVGENSYIYKADSKYKFKGLQLSQKEIYLMIFPKLKKILIIVSESKRIMKMVTILDCKMGQESKKQNDKKILNKKFWEKNGRRKFCDDNCSVKT